MLSLPVYGKQTDSTFGGQAGKDHINNTNQLRRLNILPPEGFEKRLLPQWQPKALWHAQKEGLNILSLGSVFLGSWAANKYLSRYTNIPLPMIMMGAGVSLAASMSGVSRLQEQCRP
ncbi:hypothetical protein M3P05_10330 [Sansalvadorimonas sp. 2012CJ34-2]|uniref:Uncharacterized protein n=1 Tax=Parendozoicomonas callyspongiae TaxID=2942213 RepID=A0ABT0PGF1_9GAMM|nr:hypothetical protein [Sansalvadorimonas sp. 2012CJ34-2]MCL6270316.1 hypothetical protein [Sansalvadorimonas sp. 2012CJ34-2]